MIIITLNLTNLIKLISAGFTGVMGGGAIFKYANMNKIHIKNDEIPAQEIFDTIGDKIMNSDYDILTDLHNPEVKGKDRDNCITTIQDIIRSSFGYRLVFDRNSAGVFRKLLRGFLILTNFVVFPLPFFNRRDKIGFDAEDWLEFLASFLHLLGV